MRLSTDRAWKSLSTVEFDGGSTKVDSMATMVSLPLYLVPAGSEIVSVGWHDFLPIAAVAWVVDSELVVALEGSLAESGRSTLIRVWTLKGSYCRVAVFEPRGEMAVGIQIMGRWDGLPVTGLKLVSLIEPGEEY